MFDFGENLPTMTDYQRQVGLMYGERDERARQRYNHQVQRDERDRANRLERAINISDAAAYNERAGLFDNSNSPLYNMRRRNMTSVNATGTQGTTPDGTGTNTTTNQTAQTSTNTGSAVTQLSLTQAEMNSLFVHRGGNRLGFRDFSAEEINNNPQLRSVLERGQRYGQLQIEQRDTDNGPVYRVQQRTQGTVSEQNFSIPEGQTFLGMPRSWEDLHNMAGDRVVPMYPGWAAEWGRNRRENAADIERRSQMTNVTFGGTNEQAATGDVPTTDIGTDLSAQGMSNRPTNANANTGTNTTANSDATGINDPYFQNRDDTTRSLQFTPEMQAIDALSQDNFRRAQIYTQYGNSNLAHQAFNMGLQARVQLWNSENGLLLDNIAQGSVGAAERLYERLYGYPEDTVRFRGTREDRNRLIAYIQDENDPSQWHRAFEVPVRMEDLYNSFNNVVHAAAAQANRELQVEVQNNINDNNTRLAVANIEARARFFDTATQAQIAQYRALMDQETALAGSARMLSDGDGGIWVQWSERDSDGSIQHRQRQITIGDVHTPGVDGNRTTRGPIVYNVTGTPGTTPGG